MSLPVYMLYEAASCLAVLVGCLQHVEAYVCVSVRRHVTVVRRHVTVPKVLHMVCVHRMGH